MPSQSGEYDTVEIFTPQNAPWELSGSGASIIDKKKHQLMHGRQHFPLVYTYDGSISILGQKQLEEKVVNSLIPLILNESIIVTDWIDFFNKFTF